MTTYATLARPTSRLARACTRCGIDEPLQWGRCADCRAVECPSGHLRPDNPPRDAKGAARCLLCEATARRSTRTSTRKDHPMTTNEAGRARSPRQSPRRILTAAKLPIELRTRLELRAKEEAAGEPNLSATMEQLLTFALAEMPKGWTP